MSIQRPYIDHLSASDLILEWQKRWAPPTPRVYLAGSWFRKAELIEYARTLLREGLFVTSRWLAEPDGPHSSQLDQNLDEIERMADNANRDMEDIDDADWLLLVANDPLNPTIGGGRLVEFGYALAQGKRLCVIGGRENVFGYLPRVLMFDDLDHAIYSLKKHVYV